MERLCKDETINKFLNESIERYNNSTRNSDGLNCPLCNNRGDFLKVIYKNGIAYEVAEMCSCREERQNAQRLEKSGLSPLMSFTFDSFIANNQFKKNLKEVAFRNSNVADWFFIGGQSGAGKTRITAAIANSLLRLKHQVMYVVWVDEFKPLNFMRDEIEKEKKIKELQNVGVLLIDDLFYTKDGQDITNADIQLAYRIINHRYNNKRKTIISSEKTIGEILQLDEALAGRIKERAGEFVYDIEKDMNKNMRFTKGD